MALDREGVRLPRLRPAEVARRGVVFGMLGVVPLMLVTLSISDHSDREEFLAVFSALGYFGAIFLVTGAGFWWLSKEDIRRLRDWNTITTQAASVTISCLQLFTHEQLVDVTVYGDHFFAKSSSWVTEQLDENTLSPSPLFSTSDSLIKTSERLRTCGTFTFEPLK